MAATRPRSPDRAEGAVEGEDGGRHVRPAVLTDEAGGRAAPGRDRRLSALLVILTVLPVCSQVPLQPLFTRCQPVGQV